MADCRDWQIISALMTLLRTITLVNLYETQVNSVFIPKKKLTFSTYPAIAVLVGEGETEEETFQQSYGALNIILVYTDGLNDESETVSFVERYKNVGADIIKCIMTDPSLGGLCEMINVKPPKVMEFFDSNSGVSYESVIAELNITRLVNLFDPYL
jgi:hypothetical protein